MFIQRNPVSEPFTKMSICVHDLLHEDSDVSLSVNQHGSPGTQDERREKHGPVFRASVGERQDDGGDHLKGKTDQDAVLGVDTSDEGLGDQDDWNGEETSWEEVDSGHDSAPVVHILEKRHQLEEAISNRKFRTPSQ